MATNKNITMKQFNGTDYDTLYPKTDVKQIENLTPSSIGAVAKSGDTMTGLLNVNEGIYLRGGRLRHCDGTSGLYLSNYSTSGKEATFEINAKHGYVNLAVTNSEGTGVDYYRILHTGNAQTLGFPKIAIGSYVGTGTAGQGQSTATVLTFNFAPKFLILVQDEGALPNGTTLLSRVGAYSIYGYSGFYHFYTYSSGFACKLLGWGTNTLSYYTDGADATYQFNASGKTYYYMALG